MLYGDAFVRRFHFSKTVIDELDEIGYRDVRVFSVRGDNKRSALHCGKPHDRHYALRVNSELTIRYFYTAGIAVRQFDKHHCRTSVQPVFVDYLGFASLCGQFRRSVGCLDLWSAQFVSLVDQIDNGFLCLALPEEFAENVPLNMLKDGFHRLKMLVRIFGA